jgi:hypothetical protein
MKRRQVLARMENADEAGTGGARGEGGGGGGVLVLGATLESEGAIRECMLHLGLFDGGGRGGGGSGEGGGGMRRGRGGKGGIGLTSVFVADGLLF